MDDYGVSIGPSLLSPPPPPPLALPPPPPPPPPPAPPSIIGREPFSRGVHRRSKMRSFNWDTIPKHSVVGKRNVWTSDKKLEDIPLDTERMEELFSHSDRQLMHLKHGTVKKNVWGLQSTNPVSEIVPILNPKKTMNIGILLKQFKRPIGDIVEDIREGNMRFTADRLRELCKLLPDDVEDGYAGRALGFRMTSLLRLVDTKANKPGMNLMHYVAMQAQQIDSALLKFTERLQHIGEAARIQKQEVESDFRREMTKTKEAKAHAAKQPDLHQPMEKFLQMATSQLADMEASLQELDSVSHSVAEFFCEDPATFKLEECCSIFHSFCEKFERAVLENAEREAVERRRRQQRERETLLRVAKRRTIAACSMESTEQEALESALTSFLSTRPSRRRQPSSNRESPTEMLDKNSSLAESDPIAADNSVSVEKKDASIVVHEQDESIQTTLEIPSIREQNQISATEEQDKSCLTALDSPEKVEIVDSNPEKQEENLFKTEQICCDVNTPSGPKRAACIEDKATPKSSKLNRRRSILLRQMNDENKEEDHTHEDSQKDLCQIQCPVTNVTRHLHVPDVSSPHPRGIQDMDLALQNGFGSPWTVLSPHASPSGMRRRRYSFGSPKVEEPDDGVWALPDTPVKGPILTQMCRSYEHSLSTSVINRVGIGDSLLTGTSMQGTLLRSASVGENPDSVSNFRFSTFFPRRHGREPKRQEPSSLKSFFKRFGEKGRPASIGDSCKVDT
ncbi:FH2 domain-containing protein 1 [Bagarius yarrelli]|uniref:FH2 domain-containing protein 1 n=1 Tax=Bagarius yarrelli TaxID=175774 RepID=A0A556V723_BAGYA|nr:FH2 domain-containing protein 1 [Bagarius yarrelli]